MSRKARSKIKKAFACNKEGSEEFAELMEKYAAEMENSAAYEEFINGRDFKRMNPEARMVSICSLLS